MRAIAIAIPSKLDPDATTLPFPETGQVRGNLEAESRRPNYRYTGVDV